MKKNGYGGVIGTAVLAPLDSSSRALEESLHLVCQQAFPDSGLTAEDIDGIVVAGHDQLDGRAISIMAASGSVGGVGRDIVATPSAAEHAFVLAALRIASGLYRTQLVSWSPLEVDSVNEVLRLGTDPYFNRSLPLDELSSHALQASALQGAVGNLDEAVFSIVRKNRLNGAMSGRETRGNAFEDAWIRAGRVLRWPLTDTMVSQPAFGAVATIIASANFINERRIQSPAWITGVGWATEPGFLGDRTLSSLPSLSAAARQAYRTADVVNPAEYFDAAEVADATPYQELMAYEGLGLSPRDTWVRDVAAGKFERNGLLPVNLSGGAQAFNPIYCAGLVRIAASADQVRGRASALCANRVRRAVAHAASGFAMQYNTVVTFDAQQETLQ